MFIDMQTKLPVGKTSDGKTIAALEICNRDELFVALKWFFVSQEMDSMHPFVLYSDGNYRIVMMCINSQILRIVVEVKCGMSSMLEPIWKPLSEVQQFTDTLQEISKVMLHFFMLFADLLNRYRSVLDVQVTKELEDWCDEK